MALLAWFPLTATNTENILANKGKNKDINYELNSGTTSTDTGITGSVSLKFNGGQHAYMNNPFIGLSKWSLAFWYKPNSPGVWTDIFTFSGGYERIEFSAGNGSNLTWYANNTTYSNVCNSGTTIATGLANSTWHHIAITFENGTTKIYVNGVLKVTQTGKTTFASGSDKLYFASRIDGSYAAISMQDIRCYNHCLSNVEIRNLNRALVLHYDFNSVYRPLMCVESTGTQWFDSGVTISANTWVKAKISYNSGFNYNMMYGAWSIFSNSLRATNTLCIASGGTSTQNLGISIEANKVYEIIHTPSYFSLNGNKTSFGNGSNSSGTGRNILLFAASNSGNTPYAWSSYGQGKIYEFKIYNGDTLLRDFKPVVRMTDNVVGMLDKVNNVFYANAGSGNFYGYEKVDFIYHRGGDSGINTGLYANPNTTVRMDCRFASLTVQQRAFAGNGNLYFDAYINGSGNWAFAYQNSSGNWINTGVAADTKRHIFELDGKGKMYRLYTNGDLIYSASLSSYTATNTSNGLLYLTSSSGGTSNGSYMSIYYCKILDNGTLVRDYVPCAKWTSGSTKYSATSGLFDMLSGILYTGGTAYDEVGYYDIKDSSGMMHGSFFNNTSLSSDSEIGTTSLVFNGSSSFVNAENIPLTTNMTFVCWLKFNATGGYHIIDCRETSGETGLQPMYGGTTYGLQCYSSAGGSYTWSASTCGFTTGTWYHVAVTITSSNATLYINGVSKGTQSGTFGSNFGTRTMRIGTRCTGANWFNGLISDVKVYSKTLSASDIKELYEARGMIDDKGNVYCEDEFSSTTFNLSKKGILKISETHTEGSNFNLSGAYTRLDYIQTSGTQMIDTGVNQSNKATVDCKFVQISPSGNYIYGDQQDHGSMMYNGLYNNNALEYNWLTISYTSSNTIEMTQRISGSNTVITINGLTTTVPTGTTANNNRIYLFGCNGGNRYYTAIKCYYFKMYENNVLIRDFIPVKRNSDGVIGLFDCVNGVFYTNIGSGSFTAGSSLGTLNLICCNNFYKDGGAAVAEYELTQYQATIY